MIQIKTKLRSGDNSGLRIARCIKVYGGMGRRYARLGDVILVCLKKFKHRQKLDKKKVYFGVLAFTKKKTFRKDGTTIKYDQNKIWIYSLQQKIIANRIYGPISKEIKTKRHNFFTKQLTKNFYNSFL